MAVIVEIVFGAMFVVSGALKVRDTGWPVAAAALGTPSVLIPAVPLGELALGAAIISGVGGPWPAVIGCSLLVVFTVVLLRALRLESPPVCACFGQVNAQPIGVGSVVRNAALFALGVGAVLAAS
jgi:uncharacterized membrane protein YphA (DoxX/SURF4 family)